MTYLPFFHQAAGMPAGYPLSPHLVIMAIMPASPQSSTSYIAINRFIFPYANSAPFAIKSDNRFEWGDGAV